MLHNRIIAKKNLLKKIESETALLAQSGLFSIHCQGLSRIKNNPQQIVAIEVTNESFSRSYLSLNKIANAKKGIPIPHIRMLGNETKQLQNE
ncbi:UNKNOWN [Stylonychia lemnae]|uniref:Uncharacterized protein n=1 Tax=Stylonychia lemnae TaxID=5949 RepID=A0A077ZNX1_STYLE|nr:UNKNOWN [Stylonychia lemnae]|eukprot:CDW71662.1 UNKNOWN [Stylonychia lemnae]